MTEERDARPFDLFNSKIGRVSRQTAQERLDICRNCPSFVSLTTQCQECGCFMKMKTKLPNATCPLGKWGTAPKA